MTTLAERIDKIALRLNIINEIESWRELQSILAEVRELQEAAKDCGALYTHAWDRTDGSLVIFPESVERFDKAFGRLHESLTKTGAIK